MKRFAISLLFVLIIFSVIGYFFYPQSVTKADTLSLPVITVINPIRGHELGLEETDLLKSLQGQWKVTADAGVRATWLWQYSAMEDIGMVRFAKSQMQNQEFGVFLEIDRNFAAKANVVYRGRGPWYFSDGLLLVSYDQSERRKLIDTAFTKFKNTFGYYPKSVGAWWIGADALSYMQKKYGIVAALRAADQFDLDVYSIWGTPWSIPYIPSRTNAAVPAPSWDAGSPVVMMQWAARDPTDAYGDSFQHSTYSLQDYSLKGYGLSYFTYLSRIYLRQPGDQIVVGLEGGLLPQAYDMVYKNELQEIRTWEREGKIIIAPAKEYVQESLSHRQILPPTRYFLAKSFQSDDQSFWFHSSYYRAGIQKKGDTISLVDFRDYSNNRPEDFSLLPNSQGYLRITTPSMIDSVRFPDQKRLILKSQAPLRVNEKNGDVVLFAGNQKIAAFTKDAVKLYGQSKNPQTFSLDSHDPFVSLPLIIFVLFAFYIAYLLFFKKHISQKYLHISLFLIIFLTTYPFLSNGQLSNLTFLFDRKELFLFHLLGYFHIPMIWQLIILFQLLPYILLLIAHYVFIVTLSGKKYAQLGYFCIAFLLFILYAHVPYFPIDISKKRLLSIVIGMYGFLVTAGSVIAFYKTRSKKITAIVSIYAVACISILIGVFLYSRQTFVITPFEMDVLRVVENKHKNVYYMMPKNDLIYKAIRPLLYANYHYAGLLTNTLWEGIVRQENKPLQLLDYQNKLIVVPRYLGSDFYPDEAKRYNLIKIFDNAQIVIFEK